MAISLLNIILVLGALILGYLIAKLEFNRRLNQLDKEHHEQLKSHRKDAVKRSRSSLLGQAWEQVVPFMPELNYNPSDMRFVGKPIDYIVFKGSGEGQIEEVVFLEVKSGKSRLSKQEKNLKEAVKNKKVRWEEFRV